MSIRTKLLASLLPLLVISLGLATYLLHSRASRALRSQALEHLESVAAVQSSRVEAIIDQNFERLSLVSSRTKLRDNLRDFLDGVDPSAPNSIRTILADAHASIADFRSITVARRDGAVVASTVEPAPRSLASSPSVRAAVLESKEPALIPHRDRGEVLLRLLGTLQIGDRVLGLVEIEATATTLAAAVRDYSGLRRTGETLVLAEGEDGAIYFVAEPRLLPDGAMKTIGSDARHRPSGRAVRAEAVFEVEADDYRGVPVFAVGRRLHNIDWGVIAKMDRSEALSPVAELDRIFFVLLPLAIIATMAIVAIAALLLTRRLTALTRSAERLSEGELSHRAIEGGSDELGVLARAFNGMAETVERAMHELERRNTALERKNAELERFSYSISHDLKSPLVTITGFVDLVTEDLEAGQLERARRDLERIGGAAARMGAALENVLHLSRLGRMANPAVETSWHLVIEEASARLEGEIEGAGATIIADPDLGTVVADPERMIEVVQNLLGNAVKFRSPEREPRIQVSRELRDGEPVIVFRDNGIGIDEAYRSRVFEVFERLDPDTPGTGLGLALVRQIVDFYGGDVWIESDDLGPGTAVFLRIPPPNPNGVEERPSTADRRPPTVDRGR